MIFRKITAIAAALALMCVMCMSAAATEPEGEGVIFTPTTDVSADGSGVYVTNTESLNDTLERPVVGTGSAIVMDADTGTVIYEHNAYTQRPMASTTKIMTALIALEESELGKEITINSEMLAYDEAGSTKLGLKLGDHITMHDLIVAMILLSGNDCAQSIAVEIGGSYDGFASMMNEKASDLGMMNTHFITASGLDDDAHYSTAYDMALLGSYAARNEDFMSICSMKTATIQFGNPMKDFFLATHNYLMEGMSRGVKGCDGMKTGYTDASGFCLVSHCERDGVSLVCVTLGAPSYWSYHSELYEYAYSTYTQVHSEPSLEDDSLMVIGGSSQAVDIECVGVDSFYVYEPQLGGITSEVVLSDFEYAPVSQNQIVGSLRYYYGTTLIKEFPICSTQNVECVTTDWLSAYINAIKFDMENNAESE